MSMAEMDLGNSVFEYGQTYVALSRIKSLEGLYLSAFKADKIKANPKVTKFYQAIPVVDCSKMIDSNDDRDVDPVDPNVSRNPDIKTVDFERFACKEPTLSTLTSIAVNKHIIVVRDAGDAGAAAVPKSAKLKRVKDPDAMKSAKEREDTISPDVIGIKVTHRQKYKKTTDKVSLEMFMEGKSIDEIAKLRNIKSETIMEHLLSNMPNDAITFDKFMSTETYEYIKDAYNVLGNDSSLKVIKDHLPRYVSYTQIKVVRNLLFPIVV
jgi:hypothetical protein